MYGQGRADCHHDYVILGGSSRAVLDRMLRAQWPTARRAPSQQLLLLRPSQRSCFCWYTCVSWCWCNSLGCGASNSQRESSTNQLVLLVLVSVVVLLLLTLVLLVLLLS